MPNFISEDDIERAVLAKLKNEFGYELLDCYTASAEELNDKSGRGRIIRDWSQANQRRQRALPRRARSFSSRGTGDADARHIYVR